MENNMLNFRMKSGISIGRENCDIIVSHPMVSGHHADIEIINLYEGVEYLFADLSTNGTIINGEKIHRKKIKILSLWGKFDKRPLILLAGIAELKWEDIDRTLENNGFLLDPEDDSTYFL